jgi:hypothetical protein
MNTPTHTPTPRTDAAYFAPGATMYSLAGEMKLVERELTAERKKVRLLRKALKNVKNSICRDIPDGYSQSYVDQSADECDKIIDAAMKEGEK